MSEFSKSRLFGLFCVVFLVRSGQISGEIAVPASTKSIESKYFQDSDFFSEMDDLENKNVHVVGNERIEKQRILDCIPLRGDKNYTAQDIQKTIQTLGATGYFKDVRVGITSDGGLRVSVAENPSISKVVFEGNDAASDRDLNKVVSIKPRQVLSMVEVRESEKNIRELYKVKGYYGVSVSTQVVYEKSNRIVLIFKIKEGRRAAVSKILFKGHSNISGSELYKVISSKEKRWYYLFGDSDAIYSAEKMQQDEQALRNFYRKKGFMDAVVSSSYAELAPNQIDFILTFHINEGKRYKFGKTCITSTQPKDVPATCLDKKFTWKSGDWFDANLVEGKAKSMTYDLNKKGFLFFEVVAEMKPVGNVMNVQFSIQSTPPIYVGQVTIQGNINTNDNVVRRELQFKEGDALTTSAIKSSEFMLKSLGFFETLEIVPTAIPGQDQQDVLVRLKENKSSGEMGLSGGYDTYNKFFLKANLLEKNFMGTGKTLALSGMLSKRQQALNLGLTSPYFLGRRMTVGADIGYSRQLGYTQKDFQKDGSYAGKSLGAGLTASYVLQKGLVQTWSYRPSLDTLNFLSAQTSKYLSDNIKDHNTRFISTLSHQLSYNKPFFQGSMVKSGYLVSGTTRFAGLGGSVHYVTNSLEGVVFYNFDEKGEYRLRLGGKYQLMSKLGYARFTDQFFLGGFNFPGFQDTGIGPRDQRTKDALGGRNLYVMSAKMDFPILSVQDFPIRGCFHAHVGSLWDTMFQPIEGYPIDSANFNNRVSVGVGLFTALPMVGKIGIIFSRVVQKESCDQLQGFEVAIGRDF